MDTIPSLLVAKIRAALPDLGNVVPQVTVAKDARFGDYQTNLAMVLAKQQRANPRQLAQQIIDKLHVGEMCEPPEIAGAAFINFRLQPAWLEQRVAELAADKRLGVPEPGRPKRFVIDFSSPNVAKPMHIGHIRSTILGDALARIATFIGHDVVRDNHIGDWGTQFGMLLLGWKTELNRAALEADPIGEMERLYKLINAKTREQILGGEKPVVAYAEETENAAFVRWISPIEKTISEELVKLQKGDQENLAIWREMQRLSHDQFDKIYARLGVKFDVMLGESFYNPQLAGVVQELRERGVAVESRGAVCVFSDGTHKPDDDPFLVKDQAGWRKNPAIVQKGDGTFNYTTTDLATLEYRLKTWSPDEILVLTDGRQQLHFRQLSAIFRRWHPELADKVKMSHVWFGAILGPDGKPFKTRSGETVKLAELLDEAEERALKLVAEKNPDLPEEERREIARIVGLGAVKYADLLPNRQSDYVFSWDKMLSFQGNTAPYLQYSCVRIRSIFRKADNARAGTTVTLNEPAELALAKKLLQFGEVLPQVLDDYRPNQLANYLYELASTFHSFFEACPVLKAEPATRESRLLLCDVTGRILQQGLALLGIEAPERM